MFEVAAGASFPGGRAIRGGEAFGINTLVGSSVRSCCLMEGLLTASVDAVEAESAACLFPAGRTGRDAMASLEALTERVSP